MPEVSQKVKLEYLFFPAAGDNYATFLLLFNNEQRQSPCLDLWPREYLHGSSYILASLNVCIKKKIQKVCPVTNHFKSWFQQTTSKTSINLIGKQNYKIYILNISK